MPTDQSEPAPDAEPDPMAEPDPTAAPDRTAEPDPTAEPGPMREARAAVALPPGGVVLVAMSIALFAVAQYGGLGYPLLWQDEAETAMFGRRILDHGYPKVHGAEGVVYGINVPMSFAVDAASDAYTGSLWGQYYVAAAGVALSDLAADLHARTALVRLPFAVIGSLGLGVLWLAYARRFGDGRRRLAMACAYWLAMASSVSLLLHLREVRYYALVVTLVSLLVWLRRRAPGLGRSAAVALSLFVLFNVFYPAAVAVGAWIAFEAAWPLRRGESRTPAAVRGAVLDVAALVVVTLAVAPIIVWFRMLPLTDLMSARYHFGAADYLANVVAVLRHLAAHEWLLAALLLRVAAWQVGRRVPGPADSVALWRLVLLWIAIGARNPIFFERYFVALGPLLVMAALLDFDRLRRGLEARTPGRGRARLAWGAIAVTCVAGTLAVKAPELRGRVHELMRPVRGPLDAAIPWVAARLASGDPPPTIATNYEAEAWMFYLRAPVVGRFHADDEAAARAEAAVRADYVVPRRGYPHTVVRLSTYLDDGHFERHALDVADLPYNTIPELSRGRVLQLTHPFETVAPEGANDAIVVWARDDAQAAEVFVTRPRNLVLISVDTLGAKHVGAYGHGRDTSPALDALAARGVLFEHAYTQQVWTLTAHLSLMTSLHPQAHGASEHRAAWPGVPTLAAELKRAGFETAAFTGVAAYMHPRFGLGRGFDRYVIGGSHDARDDARRERWLRAQEARSAADPDHRFFLFAHYFDVHSDSGTDVPYLSPEADRLAYLDEVLAPGEAWARSGDTELLIELEKSGDASDRDRAVIGALYDAGVRYTDREAVGRLLGVLDETGLSASTLVVLTSDHGEEIFEHGKVSHQQPFEETARVPLVFAGPGVPERVRIADLVELVDVMPTVLALLGVRAPEGLQGRDLSPLWRGESLPPRPAHVDGIFGGLPTIKWRYPSAVTEVVDGTRYSYVGTVNEETLEDGSRRFFMYRQGSLFDLDADPGQLHDLAPERPALAERLRRGLLDWYAENERVARRLEAATSEESTLPTLTPDEAEQLRALGYGD